MARRTIEWGSAARVATLVAGLSAGFLTTPAAAARAQTGPATEVPEFILPIGARTVGMGLAGVAASVGSDAVWWNPALVSRGPRELSLQITSKSTATADADAAATAIYSIPGVGAVALTARYLNEGEEAASSGPESTTGTFVRTATVVGATFAAPFGDKFAFGFTAKILREASSCSGACDNLIGASLTSALDVGAQYFLTKDSVVAIGAALQNFGFDLQVHDAPQADQLPKRADAGVEYAPKLAALPKEARIRATADVVSRLDDGQALGYRVGAELSWMERYQGRVGYVVNGPTASGGTFGFGFNTGKLQIDFAQMLSDLGELGARPTFITLRYLF